MQRLMAELSSPVALVQNVDVNSSSTENGREHGSLIGPTMQFEGRSL